MKETYPLAWPEGWPRTYLGDREERRSWKKTERQFIQVLEFELTRSGAVFPVITRQDPQDMRATPDPSVAVWFSRKADEDFGWQRALGIENPAPTRDEIMAAFKRVAAKYHTDVPGTGDAQTYLLYDKHKHNALAYIDRIAGKSRDYCIPCDRFKEVKWNIAAIARTLRSLRQMERDGTAGFLERTMKGFAALPQEASHVNVTTPPR